MIGQRALVVTPFDNAVRELKAIEEEVQRDPQMPRPGGMYSRLRSVERALEDYDRLLDDAERFFTETNMRLLLTAYQAEHGKEVQGVSVVDGEYSFQRDGAEHRLGRQGLRRV